MPDKPIVICLMGATASGKTALALALHGRLPVEIVSVDSSQVYRNMDIGTAKPSRDELARAPHRLIDIRDPAEPYSAADFCSDAQREIDDIHRSGRIPLLVGGTMFYFRALEYGLSALPSADATIRARLEQEALGQGWAALHARLAEIDPAAGVRIHPNDTQRIQRALEIYELTGLAPSDAASAMPAPPQKYRFIKLAIAFNDRPQLHDRIEKRFHTMLALGLIEEVKKLLSRGDLSVNLPSVRSVGYRQVWEYLTDNINYNQMVNSAIAATRQLAKRQITWLRSYPELRVLEGDMAQMARESVEYLTTIKGLDGFGRL
jgi:tRNA dimethylallyltransferase